MDALEDNGEYLEVNSLVNSQPVKVLVVLGCVWAGVEVEYSAKSEVLDTLKFYHVRGGKVEKKRVDLVKFGGDNSMD